MKIKIGNKVHDSENEPIMVVLSETDKLNIARMDSMAQKYCCYPASISDTEVIREWMNRED